MSRINKYTRTGDISLFYIAEQQRRMEEMEKMFPAHNNDSNKYDRVINLDIVTEDEIINVTISINK